MKSWRAYVVLGALGLVLAACGENKRIVFCERETADNDRRCPPDMLGNGGAEATGGTGGSASGLGGAASGAGGDSVGLGGGGGTGGLGGSGGAGLDASTEPLDAGDAGDAAPDASAI